MSKNGIQLAAGVFQQMQLARHDLIRMGSQNGKIDHQDILLGRLFSRANDAIKQDYMDIIAGRYPGLPK